MKPGKGEKYLWRKKLCITPADANNLHKIILQLKGLKEGDYIVSIDGLDSKWLEVNDVLEKFKSMGEHNIEIKVISCQDSMTSLVSNGTATFLNLKNIQ